MDVLSSVSHWQHYSFDVRFQNYTYIFIFRLKIRLSKAFATPVWALVFLSFGHFLVETVANGLFGVTLASVEKQYGDIQFQH